MSVENLVKRTIWVGECPECRTRVEYDSNPPKERLCFPCDLWVPVTKVEYTGPEIGA